MTSTIDLDSARLDDDGAPAWAGRRGDGGGIRLVWAGEGTGRGFAGRWWPHSRDAVRELRILIPVVSEHLGGPVTRVSLNIDAWGPDQPRQMQVDDRRVRLGWFHKLEPATVTLGRGTYDRVALLVVGGSGNGKHPTSLLTAPGPAGGEGRAESSPARCLTGLDVRG